MTTLELLTVYMQSTCVGYENCKVTEYRGTNILVEIGEDFSGWYELDVIEYQTFIFNLLNAK